MKSKNAKKTKSPFEHFQELAQALVSVPKKELDEKLNAGKQKKNQKKKPR